MTDLEPKPMLPPPEPHLLLEKPKKKSKIGSVALIMLAVFVAVAAVGITSRAIAEHRLKKRTQDNAVISVPVITAQQGAQSEDVILPGTIQAWHAATIFARTSGYIKSWTADIGTKVKSGDVLAEIDAPDLDAQFHQAQADLNTAIANSNIAQLTARRYLQLRKTDSISQQQADTAVATAAADAAMVESSKANLDHLQQEEGFKQVLAPFDGTISARTTDVGALVNGTNEGTGTGQNLFQIVDSSKLRIYVQVPEDESSAITPDITAELHLPQHPQQTFLAKLTRTADALDPTTRTLMIELEVENTDGELFAGGYTDVHLKIPVPNQSVILPVNALLFRDGMKVGVVNGNHVALKPIKIGRDYGKTVEVTDGISPGDTIVVNPPDSLEDGEEIKVIQPDQKTDQGKSDDKSTKKDKSKDKSKDQSNEPSKSPGKDPGKDAHKSLESESQGKDQDQSNDPTKQKDPNQPQGNLGDQGKASDKRSTNQSQNASDPDGQKPMTEQEKPNNQNTK